MSNSVFFILCPAKGFAGSPFQKWTGFFVHGASKSYLIKYSRTYTQTGKYACIATSEQSLFNPIIIPMD